MNQYQVEASAVIAAPAAHVYAIVADYNDGHQAILPKPYFLSLDVGEGTIVRFEMRLLGQTRSFRSLITEPEPFDSAQDKPGRTLLETNINSGVATRFHIRPAAKDLAEVSIATEFKPVGLVEGFVAKLMLQKVYREELDLLARLAESPDLASPSVSAASE